jgi:hypothetical protein
VEEDQWAASISGYEPWAGKDVRAQGRECVGLTKSRCLVCACTHGASNGHFNRPSRFRNRATIKKAAALNGKLPIE